MMNSTIKVSVIIPVYNTEQYLRQCLDSVTNQTLKDIEIICVDDGSTDGSLEILQEYANKDKRISVLKQKNQFAGVARNKGIENAHGEYLVFLDSDDFFEPDLLELQYGQCVKYNADIGLCGADRFDQQTQKFLETGWLLATKLIKKQPFSSDTLGNDLYSITSPSPWNKIFSADFVAKHHLRFQALPRANDVYFTMVAMALANAIVAVDKTLVHYRIGMSTNLQANNDLSPTVFCEALAATKCRLEKENVWNQVQFGFVRNAISQCVYNLNKIKGNPASYDLLMKELKEKFFCELGIDFNSPNPLYQNNFFYDLKNKVDNYYPTTTIEPYFIKHGLRYSSNGMIPKVSVIIPIYDVEIYLRECLESITRQTLEDIEIILVDDESPDNSINIMQEYAIKDDRVTLIRQKNCGLSGARNMGLRFAKGEYIYFLDSDDFLELNALEELYQRCVNDKLDVIFFDSIRFYDDLSLKKVFSASKREHKEYSQIYDGVSYINKLKNNNSYISSACLMMTRSDFLQKNNLKFFTGILHEDELYCFQVLMDAQRVTHMGRHYYHRRIRANSIMTVPKTNKNVKGYFICFREMLRYGLSGNYTNLKNNEIKRAMQSMLRATQSIYSQLPMEEKKYCFFDNAITDWLFDSLICREPLNNVCVSSKDLKVDNLKLQTLQNRVFQLQNEIQAIHCSKTYKIGRVITWLPRMIRGGYRCYQENGLSYTVGRVLVHLHLRNESVQGVGTSAQGGIESSNLEKKVSVTLPAKPKNNSTSQKNIKKGYEYYSQLDSSQYENELKNWYQYVTKKTLDLDNPKTFNEKIQWLKLYDSTPQKTRLADKYLVREWVSEKIGENHLIPLLGVWDHFEQIDFTKLPDQFVLKMNHGSGWNVIVQDKSKMNLKEVQSKFDYWEKRNFAFVWGFELHYMNIQPKIIAEQYIADLDGDIFDYRFFCFNGVPQYIWVDIGSGTPHHQRNIYDMDWNLQAYHVNYPFIDPTPKKPDTLEEMIQYARILSEGFAFVRVDFYSVNGKVYFGEMTFSSQSGTGTWESEDQNRLYGDLIQLPAKSPIPERKVW